MSLSFSFIALAQEDEAAPAPVSEEETLRESISKGVKSHNGKKKDMTPEEIAEKKANRKAIRDARAALKKDGKLSKEDRKKLRAMKDAARKKMNSGAAPAPTPGKDTQQMIDDADSEPETEESSDPQE